MIRDLVAALSLANLCFIEVWMELVFMPASSTYFLKTARQATDYVAAIADVLILTAAILGGFRLVRRLKARPRAACDLLFLLALLVPLNTLRLNVRLPFGVGRLWHWITLAGYQHAAAVAALVALLILVRWHSLVARSAYILMLVLSPFALVTLGRATTSAFGPGRLDRFTAPVLAPALPVADPEAPRVLWLLFDELDESIIADRRPPGLALPELDRLRGEAFYATKALSPAETTLTSLPALLSGRLVAAAQPLGPADLEVRFVGETTAVSWHDAPNVFCDARAAGYNTAVVGWYHPYCRVFGGCLTQCSFEPVYLTVVARDEDQGPGARMAEQAFSLLPVNGRRLAIQSHRRILEQAIRVASDSKPGLAFVHFSIPHLPAIFDRQGGRLTIARPSDLAVYLDNVALVDQTLGELRAAMEVRGLWDRTTVLLTADHAWRESWAFDGRTDRWVPFLLKLAGQRSTLTYPREFNTVLASDLVLAVLRREVGSPSQVGAWIDGNEAARSTRRVSPVVQDSPGPS